jgi:hypothetical protein
MAEKPHSRTADDENPDLPRSHGGNCSRHTQTSAIATDDGT